MRVVGLHCVGVFLVVFVLVRLQASTEAPPSVVPVSAFDPVLVVESAPAMDPESVRLDAPRGDAPVVASRFQVREPERTRESVAPSVPPTVRRAAPAPAPSARDYRRRSFRRSSAPTPSPSNWTPPAGPVRIALQAGHWRANEALRELSGLRDNGTSWRGTAEWEVNLEIARIAGAMLEELGYEVDVLPAVVPPGYRAHLFIAIHADGSNDSNASGFRVAAPRRDATGRASQAASLLARVYGEATGLRPLPTVTRRMRNYYAFNYRRYEHALHPSTIGVIIETGFLTSARDRRVIVNDPERAARGIVDAVVAFPVTPPPGGGRR